MRSAAAASATVDELAEADLRNAKSGTSNQGKCGISHAAFGSYHYELLAINVMQPNFAA